MKITKPQRSILDEFATWMSHQEELDVDSPEHAVDRFLDARENELTFLVDGGGYWWVYRVDSDAWYCVVGPGEYDHFHEELQSSLGRRFRSNHVGFDLGAAQVIKNFDIQDESFPSQEA